MMTSRLLRVIETIVKTNRHTVIYYAFFFILFLLHLLSASILLFLLLPLPLALPPLYPMINMKL